MTLGDMLACILPFRTRVTLGCWALRQMSRHELWLKWYLGIMHGKIPKRMGLAGDHCYYDYMGRRIKAPRLATTILMEIFENETYEQVWELREGDIVLDIGAHVGIYAVKASLAVGAAGRVIAVEPTPENCEWLLRNCEGLDNVTLVQKAIMDKIGETRLYYYGASGAGNSLLPLGRRYIDVMATTIDNLVSSLELERVDVIKIDVEGAEMEVLVGAKETLAKGARLLVSAYHPMADGKPELPHIVELLNKANYKIIIKQKRYVFAEPKEKA